MTTRTCSVEGCGRPHVARGFCDRHYESWRRSNPNAEIRLRRMTPVPCAVDGCTRMASAREMCHKHYSRWLRHDSDPNIVPMAKRTADRQAREMVEAWRRIIRHGEILRYVCPTCGGNYEDEPSDGMRRRKHLPCAECQSENLRKKQHIGAVWTPRLAALEVRLREMCAIDGLILPAGAQIARWLSIRRHDVSHVLNHWEKQGLIKDTRRRNMAGPHRGPHRYIWVGDTGAARNQ